MANQKLMEFVQQVRQLAAEQGGCPAADDELLKRFVEDHNEPDFEILVHRHAAMVMRVGQRLVHNRQDAEDVFQATFLTLARKASSLRRPASLASWLHGVAFRLAMQLRTARARQILHERLAAESVAADPWAESALRENLAVLDEELRRLPEKYRAPLILCYLVGTARIIAARQLRISVATLKRRLHKGRHLLRIRVTRRGLTLSAVLTGGMVPVASASAVSRQLLHGTAIAAIQLVTGKPLSTGLVSAGATKLIEGMVRAMWIFRLKVAVLSLAMTAIVAGAGVFAHQAFANREIETPVAALIQDANVQKIDEKDQARKPDPASQPKVIEGRNYLICPVRTDLHRMLVYGCSKKHCYLFVDGAALLAAEGTVQAGGIDFKGVEKALPQFTERKEAGISITVIFGNPSPSNQNEQFLSWTFEGFAHRLGFGNVKVSQTSTVGHDWDASRAKIRKKMTDVPESDEPMTGNAIVQVYPVRTELSRQLCGNADCVARILKSFEVQADGKLLPEVEEALRSEIGKVKLAEKDTLDLQVCFSTREGHDAVDRFVGSTASTALAKSLGFRNILTSGPFPPQRK